jgi:hypothetical protein
VFGSANRARINPAAQSKTTHFPAPVETARFAAAAFWIVVLGALFAGWLMTGNSAQMRAWKRDLASVCVSLGKGVSRCPEGDGNDKGTSDQFGAADDCAALGKAGRVCFGRAAGEKGTN